jgi:glycosyltransferase involved in cell wall biosynthesis
MSIDTVASVPQYIGRASEQRGGRARGGILHLLRRLDQSAEARMAIEFAAAFNDLAHGDSRGRSAVAYHVAGATHELQRHGIQSIEIKLDGRAPFSGIGAAKRLAKVIAEGEFGLLHAHGLDLLLIAQAAAAEAGVKLAVDFNADPSRVARLSKRQRAALELADIVTVLCEQTGRELTDALPALRAKTSVVPFGIDCTRFDPGQVTAHRVIQLARQWRVPDDRPVVMLPGRFAKERGHGLLIEALSLIRDVDLRCIMVGPDANGPTYRHQLGKEIAKLGLADRVLLAEECRDMPAAMMLADVVMAPHIEPGIHNRAIMEAMALGRPIVAIDFPVARALLAGNEMAWIAAPGDAMGLSWAIREALALPHAEREALSLRVIESRRESLSREHRCGAALDIYQDLRSDAVAAA